MTEWSKVQKKKKIYMDDRITIEMARNRDRWEDLVKACERHQRTVKHPHKKIKLNCKVCKKKTLLNK